MASTFTTELADTGAAGDSASRDEGRRVNGAAGVTDLISESFGSGSLATTAGACGFFSTVLGALVAADLPTEGTTGRGSIGAELGAAGLPGDAGGAAGGVEIIRSPGKRIPQKPTAGSVNSNST